jgi:ketosteroid isomerase-like protein
MAGDAAVLMFNFVSHAGSEGRRMRWNCTEVYTREAASWRIVHTHWSFTQDGR